jgi:pantothenate kinase
MDPDRWFVHVPREVARSRIASRHLAAGVEMTRESAEKRAEESDMPNGDLVMANLIQPDLVVHN